MTLLNDQQSDKDKIQIEEMQKKTLKLLARKKLHKGHKLFKFNVKTGVLSVVQDDEYFDDEIDINASGEVLNKKKKLKIEDFCLYEGALNFKNAIKKFRAMGVPIGDRIE